MSELQRCEPPSLLEATTQERTSPHQVLQRQVVRGVADHFLPHEGSLLAIGPFGQLLRDWLPATMQQRSAPAITEHAYALPVAEGSQKGVLALDLFAGRDEAERNRDELARVLAPGGCFVHYLRNSRFWFEPLFDQLVRRGYIPLPNFLADPDVLVHLDEGQRAHLPTSALHEDLLVASWQQFGNVLQILYELGHSISNRLIPYARLFKPDTFVAGEAAAHFIKLLGDPKRLDVFNRMLLTVFLAVNDDQDSELAPLEVQPASSFDFLSERLQSCFNEEHGFTVELSELVSCRAARPFDGLFPGPELYHAATPGQRHKRRFVPANLIGRDVASLSGSVESTNHHLPPGHCALESALHVFVARKR